MNYAFGPFCLDVQGETLFRGTEPIALSHRAVALLRILIDRARAPVSKDTLMEAAWPGLTVEESNLTVQIAALRRAFKTEPGGERWIETLPRRGYRFVGPMVVRTENNGVIEHQTLPAAQDSAIPKPEALATPPRQSEPERRLLSIVSCELVWAGRDLEDRREAVSAYQRCVSRVVGQFQGFIGKHVANTILIYFGYPAAHENDAELAVRAGLAVCAAVSTLKIKGETLICRTGIATGHVIIGDLISDTAERGLIGEVPDVAVRLQMSAQPCAVVIDDATRRLIGKLFDFREVNLIKVEGGDPIWAWRVLGISSVDSRFEALHAPPMAPFVGRDEELELVLRRWAEAKRGQGRVVVLTGEPGIGKSRLMRTLQERLSAEPHSQLIYHCSPYYQDSALHPFIAQLAHSAGIEREDTSEAKLDKLATLLMPSTETIDRNMALFSALLSIPGGDRYPLPNQTPRQLKERTLDALVAWLCRLLSLQPVLMLLEDLHWIDPTSLELITRVIEQADGMRLLLVATTRPEFEAPWPHHRHITSLALSRLDRSEGQAIVNGISHRKALPLQVLDQIVTRADGVPLFIEELTKTVLESGLLRETTSRYELTGPLPPLAIPSTLQASLLARLDRLATAAKGVAQLCAAIGREFSYSIVSAVAGLPEADLLAALSQLVHSGLIFQRGAPREATYIFKHALVQDAAYGTMVRSRRQQLHGQIAQVLEEQFPDVVASEPEVLARHFTAAGLTERGVFYWQRAGQQASDRSAYPEAAAHFNVALELLNQLPDTPARVHQELVLHLGLGAALLVTKGIAFPAVERSYLKARELCSRIGETPELAPILFGLWRYYNTRSRLKTARELGETLLHLAEHDPSLSVVAHEALGCTAFWSGVFVKARQHFEEGIQRYSLSLQRAPVFQIGEDPGVGCHMYASSALWFLGYPDQAAARMHDGLRMASKLSHPYTLSFAAVVAALCSQMRREVAATLEQAEAAVALAIEHGFPHWAAMGSILCGWALAMRDRSEAGMAKLSQGVAAWRATDAAVNAPYALAMQAEAANLVGNVDEGFRLLDKAQAVLEQQEDRWFAAEIYRLRGELLLQRSIALETEAETWLRRALEVARSQQAKSLELRAATSLAHLWRARGKHSEARHLLSRIYGWFTEGFDTIDLKYTKALIAELRA